MGKFKFLRNCKTCAKCLKSNGLLIWMLVGITLGISLGALLRNIAPFDQPRSHAKEMMLLYLPGEILLRIVLVGAVPLLVSSLISTIASLDIKTSGKLGLRTLFYYLSTTLIAAAEGLAWFYIIQPGGNIKASSLMSDQMMPHKDVVYDIVDMIRNMFPDNLIGAALYKSRTELKDDSQSNVNTSSPLIRMHTGNVYGVNMLGLTVCSIGFAIALASAGEKVRILVEFFNAVFHTIMLIFKALMWVYPIAIIFMMAKTVIEMQDPGSQIESLGMLLLTTVCSLGVHCLVFYPLILWFLGRRHPLRFYKGVAKAVLTAFATTSSTMTLPVTMECLSELNHVDSRVVGFMCPLGSNINMDGMALSLVIVVLTLMQIRGMVISITQVLLATFLVIVLSIGAPGLPGVGAPVILFESLQLPLSDIALLLPISWILVRLVTVTNVLGDCVGSAVVDKLCRKDLSAATVCNNNFTNTVNNSSSLPPHGITVESSV